MTGWTFVRPSNMTVQMNRFIILLRAVNVGGTAKLVMEDLRNALASVGFDNVQSYIASGNLIVDTTMDAETTRIESDAILNSKFNISGERSLVRDVTAFERIIKTNPYRDTAQFRPEKLHVHFLSAPPQDSAETNLTSYKGPERLRLDGQQLYVDYVNGAGTSALTGRFLETALGTSGTARNWNTVLKLAEMAREAFE
jgi:uncharacterized protein (DUF1697 family)